MEKEIIAKNFKALQESICHNLESIDGTGIFKVDLWNREEGGGGDTRIITNGTVLEKGGVLFSEVYGLVSDKMKGSFGFSSQDFYATGVSIVMHPKNPFVPIIHMNIRYFETGDTWWFGGGIDLTPIYVNEEDARYFHRNIKAVCDAFNPLYYPKFKSWADDYFFLPHRNETRGIGGIFFDRLFSSENSNSKQDLFQFVLAIGEAFIPTYGHIIDTNRSKEYSEMNKKWQSIRRSRYVEFNLLYDKGTKFGLESDGRVESILMSMPPVAEWYYDFKPEDNSEEKNTLERLVKNKAWD